MKAARLNAIHQPLVVENIPEPVCSGPDEVRIRLRAAALNHRDVWIQKGQYAAIVTPVTLGSDGCGVVEETDEEVIINPGRNWGPDERVQSLAYTILGMPDDGTFAEKICVPRDRIHPKPPHLTAEEAAALPLAGLTAWRALMVRGAAKPEERVFINGIGGGVAWFCMQFALALGCQVYVSSSSEEKLAEAQAAGAHGSVNYTTPGIYKELAAQNELFDVIIDSAGGEPFANLLFIAAPGARIVTYGGTLGKIQNLSPQIIFWKQLSILGSTMGSDKDFINMLAFVNHHRIRPRIARIFPLEDAQAAMDYLASGAQTGKVVLRIA